MSATYGYHANSTLIATVGFTNGAGTGQGLGVSRAYDKLNRLQNITSRAMKRDSSAPTLSSRLRLVFNTSGRLFPWLWAWNLA